MADKDRACIEDIKKLLLNIRECCGDRRKQCLGDSREPVES